MADVRYFEHRIRLIGIVAAILALTGFAGSLLIKAKYDELVGAIRERGLVEFQRHQSLQRSLAEIHLRVTGLIRLSPESRDEQRLYAESKAISDLLDGLASSSAGEPPQGGPAQAGDSFSPFQKAIAEYRSDIILAIEMLTVNPELSERYLVRSAVSLSRMNIALAQNVEALQSRILQALRSTLERTQRDIYVLVAAMFCTALLILWTIVGVTRRLSRNFRIVDRALAKLGSGDAAVTLPADAGDGEFRTVADGLRRFRDVLLEHDFAQSKMTAIFDSVLEGIIVIDDRGTMIQTNSTAVRLFGYRGNELIGKNVKILAPEPFEAEHDRHLERFRRTGAGRVLGQARTLEGKRRDGSVFPMQLAVNAVTLGGARYFVGVIADITDQRESERLLREARDAALSSSRLKAEFLATMSHEIRTPMNGILGMAQLLDDERLDPAERTQCVRILLKSSRTLITLLNDVLDLSKVEAGKIVLNNELASPGLLAEDTASLFREAAQDKGLTLSVLSGARARDLHLLDPARVRQMLSNLVNNAIKFTEHGGILVESSVEASARDGDQLLFRVVDTGPGVGESDLPRLFETYSQLDASTTRRHGGTGLGLSIVRQFARVMGGDAGVESEPGKGSTFWFRIPARKPDGPEHQATPTAASEGATWPQRADGADARFAGRVLVAEDIDANRIFLDFALRRLGLEVHLAANGREAMHSVENAAPFDCIFMDMRMPEMDGEEATRLIRRHESDAALPRCPIIAVTANAYDDDKRRCLDAGMDDFLPKPFNISDLRLVLERHLPPARVPVVPGN